MIRQARIKDGARVLEILKPIFYDMELEVMQKHPQAFIQLLQDNFGNKQVSYNYQNTIVYEVDQQIVGSLVGYFADKEMQKDEKYHQDMHRYGLQENIPLFPDQESWPGEWYLDAIAVSPAWRGRGIASQLIEAIPQFVSTPLISLNVDFSNTQALKLYQRLEFQIVGQIMIGQHHYYHMQKQIRN